jgi:hypothetical protein
LGADSVEEVELEGALSVDLAEVDELEDELE